MITPIQFALHIRPLSKMLLLARRAMVAAVATSAIARALLSRKSSQERRELIWGTTPIISNKYWSNAMREAGWPSTTLMSEHYAANTRSDFDLYFEDLVPPYAKLLRIDKEIGPYYALAYIIRRGSVLHLPIKGGPLSPTKLWKLEAHLLRKAGVRTVILPYGGDIFMYSRIQDPTIRHGLLLSYPDAGRNEERVAERVRYWAKHADFMIGSFALDGIGRWDMPVANFVGIDTKQWSAKTHYSPADGRTGSVRILHAPNHRGVKGTEFLIEAIDRLKAEGFQVDLVLVENVPNDRVRKLMQEVDILADQLVLPGYGLNAVEGMASGLPVICNLENDSYTQIFRRYSYLDECPIVSASIETIHETIKSLVTQPLLREELGIIGRKYIEKYHSYQSVNFMFGSIYGKILDGDKIDLLNLYHPLKSHDFDRNPKIIHPLINNHIPAERKFEESSEPS